MTRAERLARLQLVRSDGVEPRNFDRLIQLALERHQERSKLRTSYKNLASAE